MTNPPLTFIINVMNIMSLITDTPEMMIPANLGALATGTTIAQLFPSKVADKYTDGDETLVFSADILFHWVPTVALMSLYRKRVNNRHVAMALALPVLYFAVKQSKNTIKPTDPIKHLQETYPGVPIWVFALYGAGALSLLKETSSNSILVK